MCDLCNDPNLTPDAYVHQLRELLRDRPFLVQSVATQDALDRTFGARGISALPDATERLADAGWVVIPVGSDDDHAAAWEAVVFETGRSRVGS